MADMSAGFGNECHLLRYLGRHRNLLDQRVLNLTGADTVTWLDHPFDPNKTWLDGELTGLDFLEPEDPTRKNWANVWPQQGNPPNWDAVARIRLNGVAECLLVEAKANIQELRSSCKAKAEGVRRLIARTLAAVKSTLGVAEDRDWLNGYYQYCNRIAVLEFLNRQKMLARMMFLYFVGDKGDAMRTCPTDIVGWQAALEEQKAHVGLQRHHPLSDRVHELFLARNLADAQRRRRLAPGALDALLAHIHEPRQIIDAGTANDAEHGFGHGRISAGRLISRNDLKGHSPRDGSGLDVLTLRDGGLSAASS